MGACCAIRTSVPTTSRSCTATTSGWCLERAERRFRWPALLGRSGFPGSVLMARPSHLLVTTKGTGICTPSTPPAGWPPASPTIRRQKHCATGHRIPGCCSSAMGWLVYADRRSCSPFRATAVCRNGCPCHTGRTELSARTVVGWRTPRTLATTGRGSAIAVGWRPTSGCSTCRTTPRVVSRNGKERIRSRCGMTERCIIFPTPVLSID